MCDIARPISNSKSFLIKTNKNGNSQCACFRTHTFDTIGRNRTFFVSKFIRKLIIWMLCKYLHEYRISLMDEMQILLKCWVKIVICLFGSVWEIFHNGLVNSLMRSFWMVNSGCSWNGYDLFVSICSIITCKLCVFIIVSYVLSWAMCYVKYYLRSTFW